MRENGLTAALRSGRPAVCAWCSSGSPFMAEIAAHSGYDAVVVDLQHSMFGLDTAIMLLEAISTGAATPAVRCPSLDRAMIGKLLDAGAYAVICPQVDTPEQARELVAAVRYPPDGVRSFGPQRGLLYGGPDYVAHANDTIEVWAMVESRRAIANLDAIVATPGLSGVYVGPNDLALSLGEPPGRPTAVTEAAIREILAGAHRGGIRAGIACADLEMAVAMVELGFDLVTPGTDVTQIKDCARERVGRLKGR
jgi:4-hydroxy-2-oxoheptanedioate aldolase